MTDSSSSNLETQTGKEKADPTVLPPFHLHDMFSLITPERLDGTNYIEWSLNAQNKIPGRKCWGFISGSKILRWHQKTTLLRNMKLGRTRTVWSNLGSLTP